ncbi:hypothetical protein [Psychrobacillus vulpis]|uniref:LysM peptidoglycan-binding domain-containing protein n=1 Tax=Psychrobacillus vulpis TaxID=2325572 RepID=A0A544TPZ9_9BACI|nr:hypothetical protein [Psychrobacillus vulpis]TQR19533.1 hypothetical protein FG384_11405 [Psychrobacillus vulpis]
MKIFVATIIILVTFYIIKVDMFEGTIPLAFYPTEVCEETMDYIAVKPVPGDTLFSLFNMYPTNTTVSMEERKNDFYELNPHLVNQKVQDGELVFLPVYSSSEACKNER